MKTFFVVIMLLTFLSASIHAQEEDTVVQLEGLYQVEALGFQFNHPAEWTAIVTETDEQNGFPLEVIALSNDQAAIEQRLENNAITAGSPILIIRSLPLEAGAEDGDLPTLDDLKASITETDELNEISIMGRRTLSFVYNSTFYIMWVQQNMIIQLMYVPLHQIGTGAVDLEAETAIFNAIIESMRPILPETITMVEEPYVWEAAGFSFLYPSPTSLDLESGQQIEFKAIEINGNEARIPIDICGVRTQTATGESRECRGGYISLISGDYAGLQVESEEDIVPVLQGALGIDDTFEGELYLEDLRILGNNGKAILIPESGFMVGATYNPIAESPNYYYLAGEGTVFVEWLYPLFLTVLDSITPLGEAVNPPASSTNENATPAPAAVVETDLTIPAGTEWGDIETCLTIGDTQIETIDGTNVTFILLGGATLERNIAETTTLTVSGDNVNIRQLPNTSAAILGKLTTGNPLQADARLEDGSWVRVQFDETTYGWVNTQVVSIEGEVDTLPIVAAEDTTPIQSHEFTFIPAEPESACADGASSGLLIQTPSGAETVELIINDIELEIGSTLLMVMIQQKFIALTTLEGEVFATFSAASRFLGTAVLPAGAMIEVPATPAAYADDVARPVIPLSPLWELFDVWGGIAALPEPITVAEPLTETGILSLFQLEAGTYLGRQKSAYTTCNTSDFADFEIIMELEYETGGNLIVRFPQADVAGSITLTRTGVMIYEADGQETEQTGGFGEFYITSATSLVVTSTGPYTETLQVFNNAGELIREELICEDPAAVLTYEFTRSQ